jgi:hypothetical protein
VNTSVATTLAYYNIATNTPVNFFIVQAPGEVEINFVKIGFLKSGILSPWCLYCKMGTPVKHVKVKPNKPPRYSLYALDTLS